MTSFCYELSQHTFQDLVTLKCDSLSSDAHWLGALGGTVSALSSLCVFPLIDLVGMILYNFSDSCILLFVFFLCISEVKAAI